MDALSVFLLMDSLSDSIVSSITKHSPFRYFKTSP